MPVERPGCTVSAATTERRPSHWLDRDGPTTLCEMFEARVAASPEAIAYRFYSPRTHVWRDLSWRQAAIRVARLATGAACARRGTRRSCRDHAAQFSPNGCAWTRRR